jgi:hypothetical protein
MPITFYSNPSEKQKKELKERNELRSLFHDFAYNPDQPRAPKGSDTGGEWTKAGDQNINQAVKARGTELVERVAKQLGYDPKKIVVIETGGPRILVGGQWLETGGSYNKASGEITIYNSYDLDEKEAQAILAHEIMHDNWDNYSVRKMEYFKDPRWVDENYVATLWRTDGVTPYSESYWKKEKRLAVGGIPFAPRQAINETLAEIARLKIQGDDLSKVDPIWIDLFEKVNNG